MKYEWLYEQRFRTREEARAAVFEYVEIFYNPQRLHESNDYLTPGRILRQGGCLTNLMKIHAILRYLKTSFGFACLLNGGRRRQAPNIPLGLKDVSPDQAILVNYDEWYAASAEPD